MDRVSLYLFRVTAAIGIDTEGSAREVHLGVDCGKLMNDTADRDSCIDLSLFICVMDRTGKYHTCAYFNCNVS